MRNDLRDRKHWPRFRDRLPGTEIHYNPETEQFLKVKDTKDYWGAHHTRTVKPEDVRKYETFEVFEQPTSDSEPSYADFTKLAKEMRP